MFDGELRDREEAVEEGEVPAGGVPLLARLFERQRVHSRSLSIRMAHQAGFVERIHHPQRNSQRLDAFDRVLHISGIDHIHCHES